ncbi:ATP-dependent RNA helicase HrpA [Piscinibacter koreensis]|uniref:ATP-dependent RNA helicase HrpA n=1 Tax=Piscinibacter koreensis TaxID=2742824 RepID=A0A7Y6TYN0_9BURK|nr:ATP-dependent RNA helicase HrpA [Schlegelella koreensis]NUZ08300.1 ATP-dependent RNA helicase HrpA [Schlegelella koreensis]
MSASDSSVPSAAAGAVDVADGSPRAGVRRRRDPAAGSDAAPAERAAVPRRASLPRIEFPDALPVSQRRDEIAEALREHQVVIVAGETGSGKTTQLPKIALALGRGVANTGKLIGHTQPRRIAASSVAKRIADELQTPLGEVVGYKVRFQDRLAGDASVKLMTDGILLAETQSDPLLRAYDTIIIDEAHERSLNIDFLLGHLRQILPRRPDLKVVVTSATIDVERFAEHFASSAGPAPVIQVSGRMFPVEVRWRPFEERRDFDLADAIVEAVDELWRADAAGARGGDVLVFLPGEREIRDAAERLRKHHPPGVEIVSLFARLSQQEQDRVFEPHAARRIVLATNVAETSLTVPGIRYVVDSGLARVKRYSYRNKVEQLLVEPISQSSAGQRAGRCGRVSEGICIRLYGEDDFAKRPRFTDPEIMRASLAGVILRMKSLGLGSVEDFPFVEPPPRRAIADGYQLLNELGATDELNEITPVGHELARLPLDPRVGRMILEARQRDALAEVLVIAAAFSVQDVRDRPLEQQAAADQAHRKFDDERSEFVGDLKLWAWLEQSRGRRAEFAGALAASLATAMPPGRNGAAGADERRPPSRARADAPPRHAGTAAATANVDAPQHKLSNRQQEQLLREHFISPRRVREWRDIHSQLQTVVAEHRWRINASPATYEQIHLSMLSGLLGNVGVKSDEDDSYLGTRGIRFHRHPGANLSKKPGRWIVAAELVETTRLFGRGIAAIEPQWLPQIAGHVIRKQLLEPHWEKKAGEVVALERATLYGLVIYNNRRVNFGLVDPVAAREIFIREALVEGDWETRLPFFAANRKTIAQVQELEHKSRRQDVLVDDELIFAFYDQQLPDNVYSGPTLERWYRDEVKRRPDLLVLSRDELMRHEAAGITSAAFPKTIRLGGIDCSATYLHEPGDPKDGVTVTLPIYALNQASEERVEWLVPGMLKEKVLALFKSLPQRPRARLLPLPESAEAFIAANPFATGSLVDRLLEFVRDKTQLDVKRADFKQEQLAPHLLMNLRVVDENGRQLGTSRNLAALKSELGGAARSAFQALAALKLQGTAALPAASAGAGGLQAPVKTAATPGARPTPGAVRTPPPGRTAPPPRDGPAASAAPATPHAPAAGEPARYTSWTFGELPELMELRQRGQVLVGFPALIDHGTHVEIEVFDEPEVAAARHRAGLRRLVALQIRDVLKTVEKNVPGLQQMAVAYMPLGTSDELRTQIIERALDRAFLGDPLPTDAAAFTRRIAEGRPRLTLITNEIARSVAEILTEFATAHRKLKDARPPKDVADDIAAQLGRLVGKRFVLETPWERLAHLPRYLRAIVMRLDKLRADPARDAERLAELRPIEQRYLRYAADRRGARDPRLEEFRWLLEELRVSLFAQELRTPQPVSVKRLDKAWAQLTS